MENREEPQENGSRRRIFERMSGSSVGQFVQRNKIKTITALLFLLFVAAILPLPFDKIDDLRFSNPASTAFMKEHEAVARKKGRPFRKSQTWIPLKRIPKYVIDAIVVAEDGTFWSHSGFDWFEFRVSLGRNLKEGRMARGASTITQQIAKNLFLSPSKNPFRKLREWILTWYIERTVSKSRILEIYLNVIEWGNGIYGIEAASTHYFGKPAQDLSQNDATRLAAIIPNPRRHGANEQSQYVTRRSSIILQRMRARGMVSGDTNVTPPDSLALIVSPAKLDSLIDEDNLILQADSAEIQEE
ncbi:MAG TPA: monofunctional biosynthetic peptidoglycan transglycosylase [Bacteroidota bacterium]|nr:monofunctional biosynthetic peptidoglycan transglycosylase [Bacteroidota bacterium]